MSSERTPAAAAPTAAEAATAVPSGVLFRPSAGAPWNVKRAYARARTPACAPDGSDVRPYARMLTIRRMFAFVRALAKMCATA
eukprot:2516403-Pleurochrysis_carterae.AAC.2